MSKKKEEKIYRVTTNYGYYYIEKFIPERTFLWIFVTEQAHWSQVDKKPTEQEAMMTVRRMQKYDSPLTIWQSNVDELDLAEALSDE